MALPDLAKIDTLTYEYARARERVETCSRELRVALERVMRDARDDLQAAAEDLANSYADLEAALRQSAHLFERRPRSIVLHGVKVGYQRHRGSLDWDDDARVVTLIRKHLPELEATLVRVQETPVRKALGVLSVTDLRRIGVRVTYPDDAVLIKPIEGWSDKFVDALIRDSMSRTDEE